MSDVSTDDTFMGSPNPYVKCPKCGAKERWFAVKLNCHSFDHRGIITGCLWCDCTWEEFTAPPDIIEYMLENRQFRLSMAQYEPYYRDLLVERIQDYEYAGAHHDRIALILDELNMSAVDKFGGLRDIHRKFLDALVNRTTEPERKAKYQAEIARREASKKRKKKPQDDEPSKPIKWNPKKPSAPERIHEAQRGYHKDYYNK